MNQPLSLQSRAILAIVLTIGFYLLAVANSKALAGLTPALIPPLVKEFDPFVR